MTDSPLTLYQFAFSHYNEKVRWTLDYKGLAHRQCSLLPGLHARRVRSLSGQSATPVLVEGGRATAGSAAIVAHLEAIAPTPALFPDDAAARTDAEQWVAWLDAAVGPATRRAFFFDLLDDPAYLGRLFTAGQRPWKRVGYGVVFPFLTPMLRRAMAIEPEPAATARDVTSAALDRIAEAQATTGYLVGTGFTVADLTAASLLFPLFFPDELPFGLPAPRSPELLRWLARWDGHPAGAYVRRMFSRHRGSHARALV